VTTGDETAIDWVRAHTPTDAVFLVATAPAFGGTIVVGQDAGWWLPVLADRRTTAPPATVGTETGDGDYRTRLVGLAALLRLDFDAPDAGEAMRSEGVTHAYVGPRARRMDELGRGTGLADALARSPNWTLVYDQEGVQIYEYLPR
jgi:hypothetical protein